MINLLVWFISMSLLAQPALTAVYTAPDARFAFRYPTTWTLSYDEELGFLYLAGDEVELTLYNPLTLSSYDLGDRNLADITDPRELVEKVLVANNHPTDRVELVNLNGRAAVIGRYATGLLIALPFSDGAVGLIDAYGMVAPHEATILAIAASFDRPGVQYPPTLSDSRLWPETVGELRASGVIPAGGDLVFAEDYVFFVGAGDNTLPLAAQLSQRDVIVAGDVTLTDGTFCGLAARVAPDAALVAGIDGTGRVVLGQRADDGSLAELSAADLGLAPGETQRLLLALVDDRANVYAADQLVLANVRIPAGAGHYGLFQRGSTAGSTCEITGMWTYRLTNTAAPIVCEITTPGPVNKRGGPAVSFAAVGVLEADQRTNATARATGADGFTWWQLDDETWVREDVVTERGDCDALPLANP